MNNVLSKVDKFLGSAILLESTSINLWVNIDNTSKELRGSLVAHLKSIGAAYKTNPKSLAISYDPSLDDEVKDAIVGRGLKFYSTEPDPIIEYLISQNISDSDLKSFHGDVSHTLAEAGKLLRSGNYVVNGKGWYYRPLPLKLISWLASDGSRILRTSLLDLLVHYCSDNGDLCDSNSQEWLERNILRSSYRRVR